jgi:hypothetical protein
MKETKDVVACVIDTSGNYLPLAERLAREYKRVYYSNPAWQDAYPKPNKTYIGMGTSVEVVENIWDVYDEIDGWISPDVYYGSFLDFLARNDEKVWGSRNGEELELQRDLIKQHMQDLGLPVNKWAKVVGLSNLRAFLKENQGVYVKVNKWRGLIETFFAKNYDLVAPELDEFAYCLGPLAEYIEFVIEWPIDGIEIGYDGASVNGQYPASWLFGVEVKDKAYAGLWRDFTSLPSQITDFTSAMSDTFKQYGYCGFFSTETRIDQSGTGYMIDFTAREPCPPGEIYLEMIENLGEFIWAGMNGELIAPRNVAIHAVELLIESNWATNHFCPVYFPSNVSQWVKLKKRIVCDDLSYIVPTGSNDIGAVVGLGNSVQEAINNVKKVAELIEGPDVSCRIDTLDTAEETLNEAMQL